MFDPKGRTDFSLLQSRMHVRAPSEALRRSAPVRLLVFDLLHLDGESLMPRSYDERRAALFDLGLRAAAWDTPRAVEGDGPTILEASREQGLEGIMAKVRSAPYLPGRRVTTWLKVKNIRRTSAVVVGWRPGRATERATWARCSSASTARAGSSMPARSGRGSPRRPSPSSRGSSSRSPSTRRRWTRSSRGRRPVMRGGCVRSWWPRSTTPSGRATGGCGTRRSRDCVTTTTRRTWSATDRPESRRGQFCPAIRHTASRARSTSAVELSMVKLSRTLASGFRPRCRCVSVARSAAGAGLDPSLGQPDGHCERVLPLEVERNEGNALARLGGPVDRGGPKRGQPPESPLGEHPTVRRDAGHRLPGSPVP